jgi:transcriptional regulator with PAS, ATPase and Fis domain
VQQEVQDRVKPREYGLFYKRGGFTVGFNGTPDACIVPEYEEVVLPVHLLHPDRGTDQGAGRPGWTREVGERYLLVECDWHDPSLANAEVEVYLGPHALPASEGRPMAIARVTGIECLADRQKLVLESTNGPWTCMKVPSFVGANPLIQEIKMLVPELACCDYNILIGGETGTGKNLLARCIHVHSRRAGPFIRLNCAGVPETLFESMLFGHRKGAFTGAVQSQPGRLQMAEGGTLLLDEISEISPHLQSKLLRVIEDGRYYPVGASKPVEVGCRIMATTNIDVDASIAEGSFREDLYYRISELEGHLPPLRERRDDLWLLATHLLRLHTDSLGKNHRQLNRGELQQLREHHWPGNVRELENCMKRKALTGDMSLPSRTPNPRQIGSGLDACDKDIDEGKGLKQILKKVAEGVERRAIQRALENSDGNKTHAARQLQISRRTLLRKLDKYGLA